jgi:hypothetical protein
MYNAPVIHHGCQGVAVSGHGFLPEYSVFLASVLSCRYGHGRETTRSPEFPT